MLSYTGDQFAQVAIAILVYDCTRSAFLTVLACVPPIVGCPLLYGLADLFPRRRVMIICDVSGVGTVGLMAIPGVPYAALCVLLSRTMLTGDRFVPGSAIGNITFQASQILDFAADAAVVAILVRSVSIHHPDRVRARPTPGREGTARPSLWFVSADGTRSYSATACC